MIIGMGIDLIENSRFEEELSRGEWSATDGIFAAGELSLCRGHRNPSSWYASCFAAKEATLKALNMSVADLSVFREVELKASKCGSFEIQLHGQLKAQCERMDVKHVWLSIAHDRKHTVAMVVLDC